MCVPGASMIIVMISIVMILSLIIPFSALRLVMTVRSKSYPGSVLTSPTSSIFESLICPAPPSHQIELTGEHLLSLTVPRPGCKNNCIEPHMLPLFNQYGSLIAAESSEGTLLEPPSPSITQDQIDLLLNVELILAVDT